MTDSSQRQHQDPGTHESRLGPNLLAWFGLLIVFVGAVTYFIIFAYYPTLRDFPWVNLPLVVLGMVTSALGLRRVLASTRQSLLPKVSASIAFCLSLAVTILFGVYVFYLSFQLPETNDVLQVSQAVPEIALPDQRGQTVQLSELRGRKVVIDFYRGHW